VINHPKNNLTAENIKVEAIPQMGSENFPTSSGKWITDIYGGQGFVFCLDNKYWLTRIASDGKAFSTFLNQEQWETRNENLKKARLLKGV
jgi:hypothetical protein